MGKKLSKKDIARLDKKALKHQQKCLKPILKKHEKVLEDLRKMLVYLENKVKEIEK